MEPVQVATRGPDWARDIDVDPSLAAVAWLGYVQSELVEALMRP